MKKIKTTILGLAVVSMGMLSAAPLTVQYSETLPENCKLVGEIKVGDIAWGNRSRSDVVEGLKKEAEGMGANYLLMDIKRVNNPKQGIYYWGWGTAGICK